MPLNLRRRPSKDRKPPSAAGPSKNPNPDPSAYRPLPGPPPPLWNVRVLEQARPAPEDTPVVELTSRTFRVSAFSLHFALSLLETLHGRDTLGQVGKLVWASTSDIYRQTSILQGDVMHDPSVMRAFVNKFLASCRRDPPNFIVSDRLSSDGLTSRVDWIKRLGKSADMYSAKWAAIFRLNKTIVDSAVAAAARGEDRALRNNLYLLGVSVAHELVHMFVGFIYGDPERDTPPLVNHPQGSPHVWVGESGRKWEKEFFGHIITHFQERDHAGDLMQPGVFYAMAPGNRAFQVDPAWIDRMINLNFSPVVLLPTDSGEPFRVGVSVKPMEKLRKPVHKKDFQDDLDEYFQKINKMITYDLDNAAVAHIMGMATDRRNVRPPTAT